MFELYWNHFGLPLSRFKGGITDSIPFSLVEITLWLGTIATLLWIASWIFRKSVLEKSGFRKLTFLLGPLLLVVLALGQGALPVSLAPTAWKPSLTKHFGTDSVDETEFKAWVAERETRLKNEFNWDAYQSISEQEALAVCDHSLDTVLEDIGLPPGRSVRTFKPMGPFTTFMGLIYGGPAFHDPVFGELAIVRKEKLPTPLHWRLIAACHEAAHAKGFTREMDAEILTQLALSRISDPRFKILADIHFLEKSGLKIQWPDTLIAEAKRMRAERHEVERHQPIISFLRRWVNKWNLQNSGHKYGDRERGEGWNPHQPFFATIHRLQSRVVATP